MPTVPHLNSYLPAFFSLFFPSMLEFVISLLEPAGFLVQWFDARAFSFENTGFDSVILVFNLDFLCVLIDVVVNFTLGMGKICKCLFNCFHCVCLFHFLCSHVGFFSDSGCVFILPALILIFVLLIVWFAALKTGFLSSFFRADDMFLMIQCFMLCAG